MSCCAPVNMGFLADVAQGMWAGLKDPLKFPGVGASDIVEPVSLTPKQEAGWLGYVSSLFWPSSGKPTVSDPALEARNNRRMIELNKLVGIVEGDLSKDLLNYQQQLNVLRENIGSIESKDLSNLHNNIKALDFKVRGLDESIAPQISIATASALPALAAAPANQTLFLK